MKEIRDGVLAEDNAAIDESGLGANPLPKDNLRERSYELRGNTGSMKVTEYDVFPGIVLQYKTATDVRRLSYTRVTDENVFEVSHCHEGRTEFSHDRKFYYLEPGDLSISWCGSGFNELYFPQGYYSGASIVIDIGKTPSCLSCFMEDVNVMPRRLVDRFCVDNDYFICRSDVHIEHIFSELYETEGSIKAGYLKVKILELLLSLSEMQIRDEKKERSCFTRSQVLMAKGVCEYLTQNMDRRISIEKLSDIFHISGTQLKSTFKGVYGISVYAYIRSRKMYAAAKDLVGTDATVLDIAGKYGYENGSKFAKAFKDTLGVSPNAYRMAHQSSQMERL